MCHSLSLDWNSFCLLEALWLMHSLRQIIIASFYNRGLLFDSWNMTNRWERKENRTDFTLHTAIHTFFFFLFSYCMSPVPTRPHPLPLPVVQSACSAHQDSFSPSKPSGGPHQFHLLRPLVPGSPTMLPHSQGAVGPAHLPVWLPGWWLPLTHTCTHTHTPFSTPVRVLTISMHGTSLCTMKGSDWQSWMHT